MGIGRQTLEMFESFGKNLICGWLLPIVQEILGQTHHYVPSWLVNFFSVRFTFLMACNNHVE